MSRILKLASILVFALLVTSAFADSLPQGKVLEGLALDSKILGKKVEYAVYLPPDYDGGSRRYPVVYLLHGFTDDETGWIQFGEVNLAADRAIAAREIPPMIIVMPDGGVTWYINDYQGKVRFEDMFVEEFIPTIDRTYRTRPTREYRAISGLSMGGWGSLIFAMRHPDLFSACAAFSSGIRTDEEVMQRPDAEYDRVYTNLFGEKLRGQARLSENYRKYNPLDLAVRLPVDTLKNVRWYLDCGDDDFLYKGNAALHTIFRDRGVPHENRMRDGAHNWTYWRTGITDGLQFIGQGFHR